MFKKITVKKIIHKLKNLSSPPIKTLNEEYISWLSFANAGMLNSGNTYCFDFAIQYLPSNAPIIEIGSFCGLSTNLMRYLLEKNGKKNKIISSDKWVFEGSGQGKYLGSSSISHSDYRAFVKETFKRNVSFFSQTQLPFTIEEFSDDFFKLWSQNILIKDVFGRDIRLGGPISFAYVDGNHTYEFTKRDFYNIDKFLEKGGFILFDDSSDFSSFGCNKLMKEIVKLPEYDLVIKNPNYLFKKVK